MFRFRIGQGYDIHRLVPARKLILGGVEIPYERGLAGHSDADALLHAIIDALLGAAGLGDIGQHFPDTDSAYKDADSRVLLCEVHKKLQTLNWRIVNIDSTLIAQQPKLGPYILAMRQQIARDLNLVTDAINIKAKTNEKLGYLGRCEAIEAQAIVLIEYASNLS